MKAVSALTGEAERLRATEEENTLFALEDLFGRRRDNHEIPA